MIAPAHIVLLLVFSAALYFLPWVIAMARKVDKLVGIALVNLFLGWTGLGWLGALIWACSAETKEQARLREFAYMQMARGYQPPYPSAAQPVPPPYTPGPMVDVGRAVGSAVRGMTGRESGPDDLRITPHD